MNKRKKLFSIIIFLIICMLIFPTVLIAHGGRTDYRGGHRDNKNKSGLGSYHYHCGGNPPHLHDNGNCPYDTSPTVNSKNIEKHTQNNTDNFINKEDQKNYRKPLIINDIPKEVYVGSNFMLTTNFDEPITWESENNHIATINNNGYLQPLNKGKVAITAKTESGIEKNVTIEIKEIAIEEIEIVQNIRSIKREENLYLDVQIKPDNATNKKMKWESSNESIISVNEKGYIKGKEVGSTTISATSSNGIKSYIDIEVIPIYPKEIEVDYHEEAIEGNTLYLDETIKLNVNIHPEDVDDETYKWKVSNSDILKIEDNYITPLKPGDATIKVIASNGITDEMKITIKRDLEIKLEYTIRI